MFKYKLGEEQFSNLDGLRKALPHISIPDNPTDEQLKFIGVEKLVENPSLSDVQRRRIIELKIERDNRELEPVEYNGFLFDFDEKSQTRINGAIRAMEKKLFDTVEWTLADNTDLTATLDTLNGVNNKAAVRTNNLHSAYKVAREKVLLAETVEAVQAVVLGI